MTLRAMISLKTATAAALAATLFAGAALAHHGWSWADADQIELQGRITDIYIGPPHPVLKVQTASDGLWTVELGNPTQTSRAGFVEGTAKVGDMVKVLGKPLAGPGREAAEGGAADAGRPAVRHLSRTHPHELSRMEALAAFPGAWLRGSVIAYACVNAAHILGLGLLIGAVTALDLRLLGAFRQVPLGPLADMLARIAGVWAGDRAADRPAAVQRAAAGLSRQSRLPRQAGAGRRGAAERGGAARKPRVGRAAGRGGAGARG